MPRSTALRTSVACRFCENLSCSRTVCHQRPRPKIGRARVEFNARQPRACVDSRRSRTCVDRQPTQRRQHLVQLLRAVVDSLDLFPLLQRETRTPRTGSAPRARAGERHWSGGPVASPSFSPAVARSPLLVSSSFARCVPRAWRGSPARLPLRLRPGRRCRACPSPPPLRSSPRRPPSPPRAASPPPCSPSCWEREIQRSCASECARARRGSSERMCGGRMRGKTGPHRGSAIAEMIDGDAPTRRTLASAHFNAILRCEREGEEREKREERGRREGEEGEEGVERKKGEEREEREKEEESVSSTCCSSTRCSSTSTARCSSTSTARCSSTSTNVLSRCSLSFATGCSATLSLWSQRNATHLPFFFFVFFGLPRRLRRRRRLSRIRTRWRSRWGASSLRACSSSTRSRSSTRSASSHAVRPGRPATAANAPCPARFRACAGTRKVPFNG